MHVDGWERRLLMKTCGPVRMAGEAWKCFRMFRDRWQNLRTIITNSLPVAEIVQEQITLRCAQDRSEARSCGLHVFECARVSGPLPVGNFADQGVTSNPSVERLVDLDLLDLAAHLVSDLGHISCALILEEEFWRRPSGRSHEGLRGRHDGTQGLLVWRTERRPR